MTRHIHADLIHAWADGAEIQWQEEDGTWHDLENPTWGASCVYRIKPRIVKREGWMNIYPMNGGPSDFIASTGHVFSSYEAAIECNRENKRLATVKIEWEEEQ